MFVKFSFPTNGAMIVVTAVLHSRDSTAMARLGVDTGATYTCLRPRAVDSLGFDSSLPHPTTRITFGTESKELPRMELLALKCMGKARERFEVLIHDFPREFAVDGLLGLDFLRAFEMRVDFPNGTIELL